MPSRELELRIKDMLTEIEVVEDTVKDLNFETFAQNQQALRVILYGLAVIGEAVAKTILIVGWVEVRNPTKSLLFQKIS